MRESFATFAPVSWSVIVVYQVNNFILISLKVEQFEVRRRAYLLVARNQTLPASVRYQAQLQLNKFEKGTRPAIVNDRCTETGRGRGIMAKFGLCRVRRELALTVNLLITERVLPVSFQIEGPCRGDSRCSKSYLVIHRFRTLRPV